MKFERNWNSSRGPMGAQSLKTLPRLSTKGSYSYCIGNDGCLSCINVYFAMYPRVFIPSDKIEMITQSSFLGSLFNSCKIIAAFCITIVVLFFFFFFFFLFFFCFCFVVFCFVLFCFVVVVVFCVCVCVCVLSFSSVVVKSYWLLSPCK